MLNEQNPLPSNDDMKATIAEYESLRRMLEWTLKEISSVEIYVIGGMAAVWGWLATHANSMDALQYKLAWGIPVFLAVFGMLRINLIYKFNYSIGEYIKEQIEPRLNLGWERTFHSSKAIRVESARWTWRVLILLSIAIWLLHIVIPAPSSHPPTNIPSIPAHDTTVPKE